MNNITADSLISQMRVMANQSQATSSSIAGKNNDISSNNFSELLKQSISSVNETQSEAKNLAVAFEQGDKNVQLSQVMVSMQKASISFQAMLEVRNKLVSAYQDVMNMQV